MRTRSGNKNQSYLVEAVVVEAQQKPEEKKESKGKNAKQKLKKGNEEQKFNPEEETGWQNENWCSYDYVSSLTSPQIFDYLAYEKLKFSDSFHVDQNIAENRQTLIDFLAKKNKDYLESQEKTLVVPAKGNAPVEDGEIVENNEETVDDSHAKCDHVKRKEPGAEFDLHSNKGSGNHTNVNVESEETASLGNELATVATDHKYCYQSQYFFCTERVLDSPYELRITVLKLPLLIIHILPSIDVNFSI